jgi:hypothetical protein
MALSHNVVALNSSTPVSLTPADPTLTVNGENYPTWNNMSIVIQNVDLVATVYVGSSSVTSSSYGLTLLPGTSVSIDNLAPNELIYAISSASSSVSVLAVLK